MNKLKILQKFAMRQLEFWSIFNEESASIPKAELGYIERELRRNLKKGIAQMIREEIERERSAKQIAFESETTPTSDPTPECTEVAIVPTEIITPPKAEFSTE